MQRVVSGFESLGDAVSVKPHVWASLAVGLAANPEFRSFAYDVASALYSSGKISATMWVCISRIIRRYEMK